MGYKWLKILSRFPFAIKIVVLSFLLSLLVRTLQHNYQLSTVLHYRATSGFRWPLFAEWANGMAAGWIVMITDAADFCRYSRSRMDMWFGTILAAVTGCLFCTFLGAYPAASAGGVNPNFFLVVTNLLHDPVTLGAVFMVVLFDNWTINVLNLYTGGLSLANVLEKLGRFWSTLIVGVFSIALSAAPSLVNNYLRYTAALGNLFAPIAGILLVDYLLIRRTRINVPALSQRDGPYWYLKGFNPAAVLCTAFGFWLSTLPTAALLPTIAVVIATGILYPCIYWAFVKSMGRSVMPALVGEEYQRCEMMLAAASIRLG